jgi:hypothetical protein
MSLIPLIHSSRPERVLCGLNPVMSHELLCEGSLHINLRGEGGVHIPSAQLMRRAPAERLSLKDALKGGMGLVLRKNSLRAATHVEFHVQALFTTPVARHRGLSCYGKLKRWHICPASH